MIVDLFCGRGGWTKAFLESGHRVIGVDIEQHSSYPTDAAFLRADCLTLDGRRFAGADLIVASPPCEAFSRFRMPWTRRRTTGPPTHAIALFRAAERIAREAGAPVVIENVRSAQPFVGRAVLHVGPFYLWGDGVPPLVPSSVRRRHKESYTSNARAERAEIPADLARHLALFYPPRCGGADWPI